MYTQYLCVCVSVLNIIEDDPLAMAIRSIFIPAFLIDLLDRSTTRGLAQLACWHNIISIL